MSNNDKAKLNVVQIKRDESSEKILDALDKLTEMAKEGKLRSIAFVGHTNDYGVTFGAMTNDSFAALSGELDILKLKIQQGIIQATEYAE